ncbi:MAG: substrate-binding domain-containing protein [Ruminococcus sp.]|nr:substrate-binding domain-containing protein [Ruminococcus sp.]
MGRPLIAVIAGVASNYSERDLLKGIIEENNKNGYSTVVLSGIYNMVSEDAYLECERRIYELVYSNDIKGVILFCESFVDDEARSEVADLLQKLTVPLVGIGSKLKEFADLSFPRFDSDESGEMEMLTDHLIDVHGLTDIVLLTGPREFETAHLRAQGYRRSLLNHGIDYQPEKVIFGNFWMTSGEALAESMIRGERPLPQAVICANDNMAYGLLGRLAEAGIKVPDQVTVISYEYSYHRIYYSPSLTCFKRDRRSLGAAAADQLHCRISGELVPEYIPKKGRMVFGASCKCPMNIEDSLSEQRYAADRLRDYDLNLFSTMDHRMTLCRDMKEIIDMIGEYQWMIRDKRSMYLRLYEEWYEPNAASEKNMQTRCVVPWQDNSVFENDRFDLQCLFEREKGAVVCYYTPVFSGTDLFGDMVVIYDTPDCYDDMFRHWLKSVSIGLEFMRLKNDFHYLLSCQGISEYGDSLTGFYNLKGLKREFATLSWEQDPPLFCVMLRLFMFSRSLSEEVVSRKTEVILTAARAVRRFCGDGAIAGHTADDTFVCFVRSRATAEQLSDLLSVMLLCENGYIERVGRDSFACVCVPCGMASCSSFLAKCDELIDKQQAEMKKRRLYSRYSELSEFRDRIYASPEMTFAQDRELLPESDFELYRVRYKRCFGITFHQDCIAARITRAKYYLATTQLELAEISEKCGYLDHKYFQRQFAAAAGMPALQYRMLLKR